MGSSSGKDIANHANEVAESAAALIGGIVHLANEPTVRRQTAELIRTVRRKGLSARRLRDAALRKMCVGIFGPSQAGKSHLVSQLARHAGGTLVFARMRTLDGLKARVGRDTVTFGTTAQRTTWQLRSDMLSNRYTTEWTELLRIGD